MPERRWHSPSQRWVAVAALVVIAPLGLYCTARGAAWLGQPFPGFFVAENLAVPSIGRYGWTGIEADVPFHAHVVAADGVPLRSAEDLYAHAAAVPIGTPIRYTFEKDGRRLARDVPTMRFGALDYWMTTGLFALNGWLPLGAGALILLLQPATRAARLFFVMAITFALFPFTGTLLYRSPGTWVAVVHFTAQALLPATFMHLASAFPVEWRFLAQRPWVLALPYGVSLGLAVASVAGFYARPPDLRPLYVVWIYAATAIAVLWAAAAAAYWRGRSEQVRRQARTVSLGFLAGTSVAFVVFLDNARGGGHIPMNFIALTPILFFVAVGHAIIRHDLFAIDRLVRHAAEYATLTALITLLYAGTVVAAERLLGSRLADVPAFTVLFIVAVAFALDPLRRQVQVVIDRTFFRHRPDYRRTVREVSAALATMLDLGEVMALVGETLRTALALERVTIGLWPAAGEVIAWQSGTTAGAEVGPTPAVRARLEGDRRPIVRATLAGAATPAEVALRDELDALGAVLLMPLVLSGSPLGYVALGDKRSGRPYDGDDLELLGTMVDQTAIAVQNASSYELLQTVNRRLEEKVAERTSELQHSNDELASAYQRLQAAQGQLIQAEKMASLGQLVAGVAHELNNPLTFIVGNILPIREQLAAIYTIAARRQDLETLALCDDMGQILGVIGSGAERTAAIVKDLRAFSRIEEGPWSVADLRSGLRVTLNLLRPRWRGRIAIHADLDAMPAIECDAGQVNQVFMNILSNACDAITGTGNVWIRARVEDDVVAVSIRDDGAGMPPERLSRIFDPFFTTKEVGKGTGLGLSIAHGIVERHQGRITVASTPGRGSEFTVHLPTRARRRSVA